MIKFLRIKNLATIEDITLDLKEGFSILTGETGAGKSIIIDGIRFILGEKGSAEMIRTGKKETSVEAIFYHAQDKGKLSDLSSNGEKEIFIQRNISEQGTGKGYINGILVPIKKLKEIKDDLIDIYGQNDHVFLRQVENQLDYLDYYANAFSLRREVSHAAHELRKLIREKKELEAKEKEREQRLDFLDFQIKEIEKAQLSPGDEEDIHYERNILKNAERISILIEEAMNLSYNQENSISSLLASLQNVLGELSGFDKAFKEANKAIGEFAITIGDFSDFLIKFKEKQTSSPEKLETLEERLSKIEKLKRKYGTTVTEILSYLEKRKKEYNELSTCHEKLAELNTELDKKFKEYMAKAEKLSLLRKKKALALEKQIEREIGFLGMKKAQFKINIKSLSPDPNTMEKIKGSGTEEVEFLISPNPGEDLKPLRKIASGGELSRIMLALKSIGKETEKLKTLIFDEIDSGIGGKTAEFVAQKLKVLSNQHQVMCITHLPQIASFAAHHYKIEKKIEKERTFTRVKKLSFEERVKEIAQLLTGSRITETALQNAREMLTHNLRRT